MDGRTVCVLHGVQAQRALEARLETRNVVGLLVSITVTQSSLAAPTAR